MQLDKFGIFGVVGYVTIIFLLLLLFGFTTPLPLPSEEGILINFGLSETGSGSIQPEIQSQNDEVSVPSPTTSSASASESNEESVLTQDFEEAPAVPVQKKQKQSPQKETTKTVNKTETKPQPATNTKKETQPVTPKINTNALYKGRKDVASNSEGETGGKGDQGDPEGSFESTSHSLGYGSGGGVSFSLEGRSYVALPTPRYEHQKQGKVVVEITVDKSGRVVNATPGVRGSTTLDTYLLEAAKKAALSSRFNTTYEGPAYQKGTITYVFKLQ